MQKPRTITPWWQTKASASGPETGTTTDPKREDSTDEALMRGWGMWLRVWRWRGELQFYSILLLDNLYFQFLLQPVTKISHLIYVEVFMAVLKINYAAKPVTPCTHRSYLLALILNCCLNKQN